MVPIYMARGLAEGRHQEPPAAAERSRLIAGPGALQRFDVRVPGWGRRPAVVSRAAAAAPRAYGPLAI